MSDLQGAATFATTSTAYGRFVEDIPQGDRVEIGLKTGNAGRRNERLRFTGMT